MNKKEFLQNQQNNLRDYPTNRQDKIDYLRIQNQALKRTLLGRPEPERKIAKKIRLKENQLTRRYISSFTKAKEEKMEKALTKAKEYV